MPILFLTFNRPEVALETFMEVKRVKPKQLFLASDGPRKEKRGEREKVIKTRELVENQIDWDCEVYKLYREKNLGCQKAVSGAIDWFFKNVERGIILEDDCVPHIDFFRFCENLLDKYEKNKKIMAINGTTFVTGKEYFGESSYSFSRYAGSWGWATWRDRWESFDVKMSDFEIFLKENKIKNLFPDTARRIFWEDIFIRVYQGKIDSWAYIWLYTCLKNNGLACVPRNNLISNVGFGEEGTHTNDKNNMMANMKTFGLAFPLKHPEKIASNKKIDKYIEKCAQKIGLLRVIFFKLLRKVGLFDLLKNAYIKLSSLKK